MFAFLKSDLVLKFLGGFALGAVGMVMLAPSEPTSLVPTANAAPIVQDATL